MVDGKTDTKTPRGVSRFASIRLEGAARSLAALLYRRVIDRALVGVHRRMAARRRQPVALEV